MTPRRRVLVLVVITLTSVACTQNDEPEPSHLARPALNATSAELLPEDIAILPDIDVVGYGRLLAQLHGTPVVVNVWASWCIPCRAEAPLLVEAARRYGAEVQFIGLDVQDTRGDGLQYVFRYGLPFPSLFDPPLAIGTSLGLVGPPGTFFYDRDGRLVDSIRGQISATQLEKSIARISA